LFCGVQSGSVGSPGPPASDRQVHLLCRDWHAVCP
jgi:hypothetical protein